MDRIHATSLAALLLAATTAHAGTLMFSSYGNAVGRPRRLRGSIVHAGLEGRARSVSEPPGPLHGAPSALPTDLATGAGAAGAPLAST
jgi:hypothetical protein